MELGKSRSNTATTLILFLKNQEEGHVKTRLAKTIGNRNALRIYEALVQHTKAVIEKLPVHKVLYYSQAIPSHDGFPISQYDKEIQRGDDLGERMEHAFRSQFDLGAIRVMIIGSDCAELNQEHIQKAISALETKDVVIGPANDGGYYLLGMNRFIPRVFRDKPWSTENLLLDTILELKENNITYTLLDTLNDVDHEEDLTDELRNLIL